MVYHLLQIEPGLYQAVQHLKTEDNLLVPRLNRLLAWEKEPRDGFVRLNECDIGSLDSVLPVSQQYGGFSYHLSHGDSRGVYLSQQRVRDHLNDYRVTRLSVGWSVDSEPNSRVKPIKQFDRFLRQFRAVRRPPALKNCQENTALRNS